MAHFPRILPARLARVRNGFDNPDWIYELKWDGFRALAHFEHGACRLISRKHHEFRSFAALRNELAARLAGHEAILDGEIVCLDQSGRAQFNTLLYRRDEPYFYGLDCLWLDGRDLRQLPLIERKRILRALVPPQPARLLYVDHIEAAGVEFFRRVCGEDLEGIVAKWKNAPYGTEPPSWIKIKNPEYSQAQGRHERFHRLRARSA